MTYTPTIRQAAVLYIEHRRMVGGGLRYRDNDYVLSRLESYSTEAEFMQDPAGTVDRALWDAHSADWWYENEKTFEMDRITEVDEDDND